jgi:hypothetical protein
MKAAAIRAISLIVLLVIPNITSSHQLKDSPFQGDEGHWGVVRSGYLSAGKYLALKSHRGLHGRYDRWNVFSPNVRCAG